MSTSTSSFKTKSFDKAPCKDFDHTLHNMPFPEQGHLLVLANAAALFSDFKLHGLTQTRGEKNES